jgi:hypothetical protein
VSQLSRILVQYNISHSDKEIGGGKERKANEK